MFGKWRQGRLSWLNKDSSTNFMRVYLKFGFLQRDNPAVDLMPTVLLALAAPSTPESAVVEIISRAQGGLCSIELANGGGMDAVFHATVSCMEAWQASVNWVARICCSCIGVSTGLLV